MISRRMQILAGVRSRSSIIRSPKTVLFTSGDDSADKIEDCGTNPLGLDMIAFLVSAYTFSKST